MIVEHYTATDTLAPVLNTFANDTPDVELGELPGVCSHYVIDRDGTVYGLVPTTIMCRHTVGLNWTAIGIEHVGQSDGQVLGDRAQLRASLRLTRSLQGRYGIRTRNVIGHAESLTSPYHRERVARLRSQTHGDMAQDGHDGLPPAAQQPSRAREHALRAPPEPEHRDVRQRAPGVPRRTRDHPCLKSLQGSARGDFPQRHAIFSARMATALKTTTTELDDSRVRLEVEVPSDAVERQLAQAAEAIGREMKVPGFRSGKVPSQVVLQQVGRESVLDEAVRRGLPGWYEEAVNGAGVTTVGDPQVDIGDLPEKGSPLTFSIEVGVVPPAKVGDYRGIEVGRREPAVNPEEVEAELERMRESLASLETVERPAASGDYVVMDFVGRIDGEPFEGGEGRGFLLELGSGRLVPGFEEQLDGAAAGDDRTVSLTFPDDYPVEQLAGQAAEFDVDVKEVKEKRLPELNDEFAVEAGGYDSLEELRTEIGERISEADARNIETEFRAAAVDAVVEASEVEIPKELIHSKAHEMWHRTSHRLSAQGIDPRRYLEMTGKTEEELVVESEPEAELALRREAVLSAIVEAEKIEATDEEVDEALRAAAGPDATDKQVKRALKRARSQGADDALREDIAMRKAVDMIVESAKPIAAETAEAREKLWTPEKEAAEKSGEIWTPGS